MTKAITGGSLYDSICAVIAAAEKKSQLTLGECVQPLHGSGILLPLLFFSLLGILPFSSIPGFSLLIGIPIAILAVELLTGREKLWLPQRLENRSFPANKIAAALKRLLPLLRRVDNILKPRFVLLSMSPLRNMSGLLFLALAGMMALPLPFTNMLFSLGMVLLSLGLLYRDGLILVLALAYALALFVTLFSIVRFF